MAKPKFYVVWEGFYPGLYNNWQECKEQIDGFKGAKYKSFKTEEQARLALLNGPEEYWGKGGKSHKMTGEEKVLIGEPIEDSISVDAAWNTQNRKMEYQGVETATGELIFKQGPFEDSTNNIGEFLAIVHGLALLKKNGDPRPIYSDSRNAIKWVKHKKINTTQERTSKNVKVFEMLDRALNWLEHNEWENDILKWETKYWGEIPADFGRK